MASLANVAFVASAGNQESAAKTHELQNAEWRQLARGRRDMSKVKQQLTEPYQPNIIRALAGRKKANGVHMRKPSAGETKPELKGSQKKKGARATFLTIRIEMNSPQKRGGNDGVGIVVLLDAQMR